MKNIYYLPLISFIFSLNLSLHDFDNPSATHMLDAEVFDDFLNGRQPKFKKRKKITSDWHK